MKNRSENLAGRGQILTILQGNSYSIAQKSGEICTGQTNLQPIPFKSDRLLGFDNAHPVPHAGGKYVKPKPEADHWHRTINDEGRPYTFASVEQLLEDFFAEVEKICEKQGISTEVVDDKET